jgi:hypothetical protein
MWKVYTCPSSGPPVFEDAARSFESDETGGQSIEALCGWKPVEIFGFKRVGSYFVV